MNKFYILLASLALVGCKTTNQDTGLAKPVQVPELPTYLSTKAESLPQINNPSMGSLMIQGAEDDSAYNDVATRLNKVIDLYNCIRIAVNTKTETEDCLK